MYLDLLLVYIPKHRYLSRHDLHMQLLDASFLCQKRLADVTHYDSMAFFEAYYESFGPDAEFTVREVFFPHPFIHDYILELEQVVLMLINYTKSITHPKCFSYLKDVRFCNNVICIKDLCNTLYTVHDYCHNKFPSLCATSILIRLLVLRDMLLYQY